MRACFVVVVVSLVAVVAGCSSTQSDSAQSAVRIVASTDVWGSVAAAVAGDHATVTSIVTGVAADPHSYEATPADAAKVSDATLVVFNGGGYDQWMDALLDRAPDGDAAPPVPRIDAFSLLDGAAQPANEHVFYDLRTVGTVAERIAAELATTDPPHSADYTANAEKFGDAIDALAMSQRAIGQTHPGASVVATEPVAYYALRNAGIADKTPVAFANAVEAGGDPAPADLAAMLDLITTGKVSAVVVNSQTETPTSQQIADAAQRAGLPRIAVTETLPDGEDYLQWQRATVEQFAAQLDHATAPAR